MARYRVQGPDGVIHVFEGPDDATPADVEAFAAKTFAPKPAPEKQAAPAEDPGIMMSTLIGAGRTIDRVSKGAQQAYYGAKSQFESPTLSSLVTGKTPSQIKLDELKKEAESDDAIYKPLAALRPWSTGIGEALPSMIIPAGGSATLLGNAGRMALAGGLPGALEYGSLGERATRAGIGAAAGAAAPVAGAAVKSAWSLAEPLWQGGRNAIAGRTLNRVAGDAAPQVAGRMSSAASIVPGSIPTAAEVAENGGIAALQRSASASNPSAYTQRAMEQSSARLNALRGIAGTDADMASAVAARGAATDPLYALADAGIAPVDSFFKSLQARPQFQAAVNRAQELAKNGGLADIFFRDSAGKPIGLIGQGAHFIKKALDEASEFGSTQYTSKQAAIAANSTNDLFQKWLTQSVPAYGTARDAFARASRPINQMQIGQELLGKLEGPLADFGGLGNETGARYALALRNADQTAASATGFPGAKLDSVMSPTQMKSLAGIGEDLARKANAQNLGRGVGSDTFQKLSMQNIAQQSGMPALTSGLLSLPGVSRATNWVYRDTDQKLQGLLADALLNPAAAAKLMTDADKRMLQNSPLARRLLEQSAVRGTGLLGLSSLSASGSP